MDYLIPKKTKSGEDIILEDWQVSPNGNKSKAFSFWNLNTIVKSIIDSAYIYSIVTATYIKSIIDATYIKSIIDSVYIKSIVDATYIKSIIDSTYIQGIVNATYIKSIIDATYIQSIITATYIKNIVDATYIKSIIDSVYIKSIIDGTYIKSIIDSTYIQGIIDSTYLASWFTSYFPTYYAANRTYFPITVIRTNTDVSTSAGTDTIVHTLSVPAGTVGATDLIEITNLNYKNAATNAMTVKWWFSTSNSSIAGAIQVAQLSMTAGTRNGSLERHITMKSINSQRIFPPTSSANSDITSTTTATATVAVDFSVNQWFHVTINTTDVGTASMTQLQIMKQ